VPLEGSGVLTGNENPVPTEKLPWHYFLLLELMLCYPVAWFTSELLYSSTKCVTSIQNTAYMQSRKSGSFYHLPSGCVPVFGRGGVERQYIM
jgi:hypothetical protein